MTGLSGFEPRRVRALARHTVEAIEALGMIRSDDPAAADAVHAARNTRRNLEDTWMPLLRAVESSSAMTAPVAPTATGGLRAEWSATAGWLGRTGYGDIHDDELLDEIVRLDEEIPYVGRDRSPAVVDDWLAERRALATEISRRVWTDQAFAARVVDAAYASPLVGLLVGLAEFPAGFRADLLASTLADPWWEGGWEMDKYASAADTLLASLLDDPARCLDVLGRDGVAPALAAWPPLDQDLVARFVISGLRDAPRLDDDWLPVGYDSLDDFLRLANEQPIDGDGFRPGVATGLASSIETYVPTMITGLENEHATVEVRSHGGRYDRTLGTREEVVDLFGAMIRTPQAQEALGRVLGMSIVDAVGPDPEVTVRDVAEFAELLDLAARNEDEELAIAAAARRTSILHAGGVIALGIAVGTALRGVNTATRDILDSGSRAVADGVSATVRADAVGGRPLRQIAFESIQIEACRRFATDRDLRREHGAAPGADRLASIRGQLDEIAQLFGTPEADPAARQRAILNLVDDVRDAGGGAYLDAILDDNSVDDLDESDHAAD